MTEPLHPDGSDANGDRHDPYLLARRRNLEALAAQGIDPWPPRFEPTHTIARVLEHWTELAPAADPDPTAPQVTLAGRVTALRHHGRSAFADLLDATGGLQLFLRRDRLGEAGWRVLECVDLGDWVGVRGPLMVTRMGERSLRAEELTVLAKSLRPLPTPKTVTDTATGQEQVFHAFDDKESRYRRRYLDLIVNPGERNVFRVRAALITELRRFLDARGFLEVDTPVLQPLHGGASARPFITRHNALGIDLYLRIALELYHKRLIVGGLDRVYEIGRIFRNEGLDRRHNPEFTMLELYQAYADYQDIMRLVEDLFEVWCDRILEGADTVIFDGRTVALRPPFARRSFGDLLAEHAGFDAVSWDQEALAERLTGVGISLEGKVGRGALLDAAFTHWVEPHLWQPTFVIDHPVELSPLARRHRDHPALTERFELMIAGMEFANAFSELNDPDDQRARFHDQLELAARGDMEAQRLDEDFLRALEYGLPPTGGLGIGIDRVTMLFTGRRSIREVILFPTLRPEEGPEP